MSEAPSTSQPPGGAPTVPAPVLGASPVVTNHGKVGLRSWSGQRLRRDLSNWRLFLVRLVTSGLAVTLTVVLLPGLRFTSWHWGEFLLVGLVFGLLNAIVKPILQFFSLRYLVATYGLVVLVINAALLLLLAWILGGALQAKGLLSVLVGGLVVGFLGLVLDTLAGVTPPIVDRPRVPAPAEDAAPQRPAPSGKSWDEVPAGVRWYEPATTPSDDVVASQAAAVLAGLDPDDVTDGDPPDVEAEPGPPNAAIAEAEPGAQDATHEEGER